MSDVAMAPATAPAAPTGVPIDNAPILPHQGGGNLPEPRGQDQTTEGRPPNAQERKSIDDIIKSAHEKVTKKNADKEAETKAEKPKADAVKPEKVEAKEPVKDEKPDNRGKDGRFQPRQQAEADGETDTQQPAPKQPQTGNEGHRDPPPRFSADAKAEWANAPESVKAEAHRAIRELEQGYQKYRGAAEAYSSVQDFDQYARQNGTTLRNVLTNYVSLENALVQGDQNAKNDALKRVFDRAGIDPRQWAAQLLRMPQDQRDSEQAQVITNLRNEIAQLKNAVSGVASHVQQQQQATVQSSVANFAKSNPRFDELSSPDLEYSIQNILRSNMVPQTMPPQDRLQKAYEIADRLNPGRAAPAAPLTQVQQPTRADKSIAGSPANGSDPKVPQKKGGRVSIDDAIKRAAARLAS